MGRDQKSVVAMVGQERKTNKKNGSLGFRFIFMHADGKDLFLMVLGTIGAVGEGLATPLVLYISSRMMNNIGISSNMDGNTFIHNINKVQFFISLFMHTRNYYIVPYHHIILINLYVMWKLIENIDTR